MEPLETPKTLDEALVMSQLGQDQILSSETLEGTASGDKCNDSDLASSLVSVKENVGASDDSCERMEIVNGESLFVGVGKMLETTKALDKTFVTGQDEVLGSEVLEGAASGYKCNESDLASVVSVRDNGAAGDVSCECMESGNGESLFVGVGKILETTKTLDEAFVVGQNQILGSEVRPASGDKCCEVDFVSLVSATDNGGTADVNSENMESVNEEILFVDGGKMLETSKTVEDFVIGQDQILRNEDLEEAASGDKCCKSDFAAADVSCKHQERVNEEGQFLDAGEMLEDIEGEIMVGGVTGVDDSGENTLGVGRIETGTLVDGSVAEGIQMIGSGTETVILVADEAFAEGNQMGEGSLEQVSEGKSFTVPRSSEMGNEFGLVQDLCSTGCENEEDAVEKAAMQEEVEDVDASELNLVDMGNTVEDSRKGISLCVEVFGPLDGLNQCANSNCLSGCRLFGSNLSDETLGTEDADVGGSFSVVPDSRLEDNSGGIDLNGNIIDDPGYSFNVGDFAWAETKAQSWWPALICEPSDAGEAAVKTNRKTGHLVRYFGNDSLLWCLPSQLKPFHECFEQISRQNNSRGFLSAVEKAVCELGRRLKLEMTCPCFLERRDTDVLGEEGELLMEKECKLGDFSLIQFDPENLLVRIKSFAMDVSVPGMIEFTVIQNHLSAFYRSIGHQQLPLQQLKPAADAKSNAQDGLTSGVLPSNVALKSRNGEIKKDPKDVNDEAVSTMFSSEMKMANPKRTSKSPCKKINGVDNDLEGTVKYEKGYESRERRKSKYLSFPYVDLSRGNKSSTNMEEDEMQDPKTVSHVRADKDSVFVQSLGSTPVAKSSGKKTLKRSPKKPTIEHYLADKREAISSTEMLSELRFIAVDCLYPDESSHFDVVERFFSGFRRLTFRDFTCEIANEDTVRLEFDNQMHLPQTLTEIDVQMEKGMEIGEVSIGVCNTEAAGVSEGNKIAGGSTSKSLKGKSKQTEKKEKTTHLGSNNKPVGDVMQNVTISGPVILDFQKVEPEASEGQSVPKTRKRKAGIIPGIPQIKVMAGLPDLNGSSGLRLEGWNSAGAASPHKGESESQSKEASLTSLPDVIGSIGNTATGTVLKDVPVMGLYSTSKGTQKDVSPHLNAELIVNQQYVNQIVEPNSVISDAYQIGILLPGGKPEPKKRNRKQKAPDCQTNVMPGIPDLNGNASESRLQGNQLPEMNCIPSQAKPQRKRRRKKTDAGLLEINLSSGELQTNADALGTALLLKFCPEQPMPPKENLLSTFSAFGPLKESETQVLNDSATAQIVFASSSDARNAFLSLEKSSPFGPALVNYRLQVILATSRTSEPYVSQNMRQAWPADKVKSPQRRRISKKPKTSEESPGLKPQRGKGREVPDLQFVKRNLQKMTSMLENAGNNLSPEMRAKLESEIKSLLQKVSSMVGSSSST